MGVYELVPHPDFPTRAVTNVTTSVEHSAGALLLRYSVAGTLDLVRWPGPVKPTRTDELWKHTCFEAFIGHPQTGYVEYNFSPSGEWAAYFFDWYRDGMRAAKWLPEPVVHASRNGWLNLTTEIDLTEHLKDGASHLALSAVIEERDGTKSYWALAHAPGPPDFHHADCFAVGLPKADPS